MLKVFFINVKRQQKRGKIPGIPGRRRKNYFKNKTNL